MAALKALGELSRPRLRDRPDVNTAPGLPGLLNLRILAFCVVLALTTIARGATSRPPNIIFFLVDDLGWTELNCYNSHFNETPNLDRLASEGIRFTQAYAAASVCSPTRAALMTGQYPARLHITDYLRPTDDTFLSPDYITLNEQLNKAGYISGIIGKWHLNGDYGRQRGTPKQHAFDEVICSEQQGIASGGYWHPYKFMPNVQARLPHEYLTDRLDLEAVEFIHRHKDHPFFLYLAHYAPHTRLVAKPDKLQKYGSKAGAGKNKNNPELAAMLESLDEGMGHILAELDRSRLTENTIVIFMSDNGGERNVTDNFPLRGGKSFLYEGGLRVPCIIKWPGHIKPNQVCDEPIITQDFYPTLLDIAGVKPDPSQVCDGVSLLPLFGGKKHLSRDTLYWHYPLNQPHFLGGRSASAMRRGNWKLIEFLDTGQIELYDLSNDLSEAHDLSAEMPERTAELRKQLDDWKRAVKAKPHTGVGASASPGTATVGASHYQGWTTLGLSNGLIELQLLPEIGGRIIQFKLAGTEFLWANGQLAGKLPLASGLAADGTWFNCGGDKLWPAPQGWDNDQQWPGPPDAVLDGQPYVVEKLPSQAGEIAVRLTSREDPRSGIQFSRVIRVFDGSTRVSFDATMKNVDRKPRRWGIWAHTQLNAARAQGAGPNLLLQAWCPLNPKSRFAKGYSVIFGAPAHPSFRPDSKRGLMHVQYQYQVGKIGLDSDAGWVATVNGENGAVFVQRFRFDPGRAYPDGSSVEFWLNGAGQIHAYNKDIVMSTSPAQNPYVLESEILSPFAALQPGESYTWHYDWYAANVGADFPVLNCSGLGVASEPLRIEIEAGQHRLKGRFGVFRPGGVRAEFCDGTGRTLGKADLPQTASPAKALVLDQALQPPPGASVIKVLLVAGDGKPLGELGEAQLQDGQKR